MASHGMCETRIYDIWRDMRHRCSCTGMKNYKHYGGRGISVCKKWDEDFMEFYNWAMENGYSKKLTIDRINNDGNYNPNNCRWANKSTQNANRRNSGSTEYIGVLLITNKSSYRTTLKIDGNLIYSYSSKSKNDCAEKRNQFIIENNLDRPLNKIKKEIEDVRINKNIVFINIYDKNNCLLFEKVKYGEACAITNLSNYFIYQCIKGKRKSKKYIFERCL